MSHKCAKCEREYASGSIELTKGCACGAKVFLYFNSDNSVEREQVVELVQSGEAVKIEESLQGWVEEYKAPLSLEVENIRVVEDGVFEVNVGSLIQNPLVIVKGTDGVYYVKLPKTSKSNGEVKL
ncbi:hypothetical protein HY992_06775 [Candidatus Micrarchaeota archaeon]|nr:hypothetical protein [Candidatus Micrarchaeota archaeon]